MPRSSAALLLFLAGCSGKTDATAPEDSDPCAAPCEDTAVDSGDSGDSGDTAAPDPGPWSLSLLPEGLSANLLLPYDVAVDAAHGSAWATSLSTTSLAEIDLDTQAVVAMHDLGDGPFRYPEVVADGAGHAWVVPGNSGEVIRVDAGTGAVVREDAGVDRAQHAVGLPPGGIVVAGVDGRDDGWLVRLDERGRSAARQDIEGVAIAVALDPDEGEVAVVTTSADAGGAGQVRFFDTETLAELRVVEAPFVANALARMAGGDWILASERQVARLAADGSSDVRALGTENKEVVALSDGTALLFDRIAGDALGTRTVALARRIDASLDDVLSFATGKNAGFGGYDGAHGLAWVNSEGTTSVQAYDPLTGERRVDVPVGRHLEWVVPDEEVPGSAWVAGRLSSTLVKVDLLTQAVTAASHELRWPVSPVHAGERLWVVDHLTQELWALDPDTLGTIGVHSFGLAESDFLAFGSLAWDDARDALWMVAAQENVLLRLGPDGEEQWRSPLPGDLLADIVGSTALAVDAAGVATYRSQDGVLAVYAPESDTWVTRTLSDEERADLALDTLPRVLALDPDGATLWLAGHAYDRASLERTGATLGVDRVLATLADGGRVGWVDADPRIVQLDAAGAVVAEARIDTELPMDAGAVWSPGWQRALYVDAVSARVTAVTLEVVDASR